MHIVFPSLLSCRVLLTVRFESAFLFHVLFYHILVHRIMNNYLISGAGPPLTFFEATEAHMDCETNHPGYFDGAHHHNIHDHSIIYEPHTTSEFPSHE
jgi:hypothetical protein